MQQKWPIVEEQWWKLDRLQQCSEEKIMVAACWYNSRAHRFCSVFGETKGVLHYELLQNNQMINSEKCCSLPNVLHANKKKKHPLLVNRSGIVFQEDNARSLWGQAEVAGVWWDIGNILQTLFLSYYTFFRSLQNSLNGTRSNSSDLAKNNLGQRFVQKSEKFWEDKIFSPHDRWPKVVQQ